MPKNDTSSSPPHAFHKSEPQKSKRFLAELDARKLIHLEGPEEPARRLALALAAFNTALELEEKAAAPGSATRARCGVARALLAGKVPAAPPPEPAPEPRSDGRLLSALLERTGELASGLEAILIVANGKGGLAAKLEAIERMEQDTLARLEELEAKVATRDDLRREFEGARVDVDELDATGDVQVPLLTWDRVRVRLKIRDAQLQALVANGVLVRCESTGYFHQGFVELAEKGWAPIAKALASDSPEDWRDARFVVRPEVDAIKERNPELHDGLDEEDLDAEAAHLTPPIPPPEAERPDDAPPLPYSHEEEDPDGYRKGDIARDEVPVVDRRTLSTGGDS